MIAALFRGFRPRLIPSVIAGLGVAFLLSLSVWQLFRMAEKREINTMRAERLAHTPIELPARIDDPQALDFRRVILRGSVADDRELFLQCRSQRGNDGNCILVALHRPEGLPVLINRGWVPPERKDPARRPRLASNLPLAIEGVLRISPQRNWAMPANDPQRNIWFSYDLPVMARALGVDALAPVYLEASVDPRRQDGAPLGGQTRFQLPDNHLQYAITWFALALALAVIFVISQRQDQGEKQP
jgi:surfeit locus 1 family protein